MIDSRLLINNSQTLGLNPAFGGWVVAEHSYYIDAFNGDLLEWLGQFQ